MTTKYYINLLQSKAHREEEERINATLSYKKAVKSEMDRVVLKKQLAQIRSSLADRFYEMSEPL